MMDDERIERALRAGPPDEDRYAAGTLDVDQGPPVTSSRSVRPRSAVPAWVVIAGFVVVLALVALSAGRLPGPRVGEPAGARPQGTDLIPSPSYGGTSSAQAVIPWLDAPVAVPSRPTPVPAPPPPGLAPCRATNLDGELSGWGAAAGTTYFRLEITNASGIPCYLQGTPDAQVLDGQRRVVLDGAKSAGITPSPPSVSTGDDVTILQPGTSTVIGIGWSDWCGPAISGPISFALILPSDGGRLVATWAPGVQPLERAVNCMGGSASRVFANGPFQPTATSGPPTPEPTPLPLQIAIGQRQGIVAAQGTLLHFTVTLTNISDAPLDLRAFADGTSCPIYEEEIVGAKAAVKAVAFTLNCTSVGPLTPGASVTFAMQMPTAGVSAGDYVLSWALAPQKLGPAGKTSLTLR